MEFKYPQVAIKSHRRLTADHAEIFTQWIAGLPAGKYRTADLLHSFRETIAKTGQPFGISLKAFSLTLGDAGLSKFRDSTTRYHIKD